MKHLETFADCASPTGGILFPIGNKYCGYRKREESNSIEKLKLKEMIHSLINNVGPGTVDN